MRSATIQRDTKETRIGGTLRIDGKGRYEISTGVRFFDHMLELFTKHGGFDLRIWAKGDLEWIRSIKGDPRGVPNVVTKTAPALPPPMAVPAVAASARAGRDAAAAATATQEG